MDDGDRLVILLDHDLTSLPDLLQSGVHVARQVRFTDMQYRHTSDDTSSSVRSTTARLPLFPRLDHRSVPGSVSSEKRLI